MPYKRHLGGLNIEFVHSPLTEPRETTKKTDRRLKVIKSSNLFGNKLFFIIIIVNIKFFTDHSERCGNNITLVLFNFKK